MVWRNYDVANGDVANDEVASDGAAGTEGAVDGNVHDSTIVKV